MRKLIGFVLLFIIASCAKYEDGDGVQIHSNGYIGAYYQPIEIAMEKFNGMDAEFLQSGGYINVYSKSEEYHRVSVHRTGYNDLAEFYGDTAYDTTFSYTPYVNDPHAFLADEIDAIEVTSTSSYNGIPAGSDLSSQFYFYAMSMYPFIQSGYTDKFDYVNEYAPAIFQEVRYYILYSRCNRGVERYDIYLGSPIYGGLDEIATESLKLIGGSDISRKSIFLLQMKQIPSSPEGELIVKISFKGGDKLEARASLSKLI
ncbi:MAG: hypothetical protein IKC17_04250 [Bacteroidales bacterium]|nr:hypothetical protein [Bacteroidales bacterium]